MCQHIWVNAKVNIIPFNFETINYSWTTKYNNKYDGYALTTDRQNKTYKERSHEQNEERKKM